MKILFSGICPFENTGYGIQTNNILKMLIKNNPSIEFGIICWNLKKEKPNNHGNTITQENDTDFTTPVDIKFILKKYVKKKTVVERLIFKKTYKNVKFYTLYKKDFNNHWEKIKLINDNFQSDKLLIYQDIWVFDKFNIKKIKCEKYLYLPIHNNFKAHGLLRFKDNLNKEEMTLKYLPFFNKIATFSTFGVEVLKQYKYDAVKINHIIKDIEIEETKIELREKYSISNKFFICLMIARNGEKTDRKAFAEQFEAFSLFSQNKKNSRLLLHIGNTHSFEKGAVNLKNLAKKFKISKKIIITDNTVSRDRQIRELYKLSDVLLCASKSEGFGLPMVEAQFMKTPVITTDCTSMSENTFYGIKTKPKTVSAKINNLNSWSNPSPENIHQALEDIYLNKTEKHNFTEINKENYEMKSLVKQWENFLNIQTKTPIHDNTGANTANTATSVTATTTDNTTNMVINNKITGEDIFNTHLSKIKKKLKKLPIRKINKIENCKYNAVLIETRESELIEPQILNLLYLTDEDIGLQIFYHNNNKKIIENIIKKYNLTNVSLIKLENNITTNMEYNNFMFSKHFYDNLKGEKILIFQLDSLLLRKLNMIYFKYDWIGAIWNKNTLTQNKIIKTMFKNNLPIGNGGFNIRNIELCGKIAKKYEYKCPLINNKRFNEDNIYSWILQRQTNAIFPTVEEAKQFSVETIKYKNPMAIHAAFKYLDKDEENLSYLKNIFENHYKLIKEDKK